MLMKDDRNHGDSNTISGFAIEAARKVKSNVSASDFSPIIGMILTCYYFLELVYELVVL